MSNKLLNLKRAKDKLSISKHISTNCKVKSPLIKEFTINLQPNQINNLKSYERNLYRKKKDK